MDESGIVLYAADGVRLDAVHLRGDGDLAIVMAHGFSGTWRHPRTRNIAATLRRFGGVIGFDFRGHGGSTGVSTVGDQEILDVDAAVTHARDQGYSTVAVVGFSMGASVAVRHAALLGGVDAVASVSGPAHWYYRGTTMMRWVHRAVEWRTGRAFSRAALRTRIGIGWEQIPLTPEQVAGKISPTPLLVVHGDRDRFFPLRHAHAIYDAAGQPRQLWIEPGMGHAESGTTPPLARRLGAWLAEAARR
ncbi:MAG TPA: alpha/beta fold hydrolase [Stackebrandtia sp.]|jgi:pimeloyl-ACP methyl ester carboxylesterase|uniref:alpha/beta hydrolase n=1 Tax=Stackebrandtia sp. TaxID=2023065 RepID=UPI002D744B29|nr:alpha/beta fold hydrolase [Stackebrandtia sp.]HZE39735.1 alpha/beta fold hydrolase [Stackebrandtia sp.]